MSATTLDAAAARPKAARSLIAIIGCFVAVVATLLAPSTTVSAHTGFESSTPADGASIEEAVDEVTIVFTGEATPVGEKFVARTPSGDLQEASSIDTLDNKVFTVRFEPPLAGGQIGIRWNVQAADAHPIEGAFSFTVSAAVPTTASPSAGTSPPPSTVAPAVATDADTTPPAATEMQVAAEGSSTAPAAPSLDEFLTVDQSTPGETTATVGRLIGFLGVAVGLGALAFVAGVLRGRRDEIRHALVGIRILGVVIVVGAAIEYVGVTRIAGESVTEGWSTAPGFATVLRMIGGVLLAVGIGGTISRGRVRQPMRRPSVVRSLSAAMATDEVTRESTSVAEEDPIVRWSPDDRSWPSIAAVALILASFWFDGHTVSKGFRPLHALVNSIHVAAGAVWVGGVVTMAAVVWSRYRSEQPMRIVELVVRFSKIATVALASVIVAGGLMAFFVLDSVGELTGTTWGQILLLKSAAVGLAVIGGAYNHFRLLPALESDPESPELLAELRSTLTAEAIILSFVVAVTAWLVAAAS